MKHTIAAVLSAACTSPTRRSSPVVSDQSAAPLAAVGQRAEHAEPHQGLRRGAAAPPADEVERERAGPEPDGEIGEQRVQRVSEPPAGQQVAQLTVADRRVDALLQLLRHAVDRVELLDLVGEAFDAPG